MIDHILSCAEILVTVQFIVNFTENFKRFICPPVCSWFQFRAILTYTMTPKRATLLNSTIKAMAVSALEI